MLVSVALVAALAAGMALAQQPDRTEVIARVTITGTVDLRRFVALGLDMLEYREHDDFFILTTAAQIEQLRQAGWDIRVDERQSAQLRRAQPAPFTGGYHTVGEARASLDDRATQYPTLTQVFTYGRSYEGRELFGIRLSNKQITGTKPALFLMAAIHARELSTTELALRLVDYLLSNYGTDGDATWLLDEHLIVIVPVANPDGREISEQGYYQRKNTDPIGGGACAYPPGVFNQNGVDLNRNADFKWGIINTPGEDPCGQTYPGPSAASEPEIIALQNLIRSLFPDQRGPGDDDAAPITTTGVLLTLHSFYDLVLYPWGWTYATAPNRDALNLSAGKYASYNGYTYGQSTSLYPTSGTTDDWAYGELGIASFTFEVGGAYGDCGGFFPLYSCLDGGDDGAFWPRNLPAFLHAARIARAPYQLAQGPATDALTVTAALSGQAGIQALLSEQYSGGQVISAAEYYVDTPPWRGGAAHPLAPLDGAFDSASERAAATGGISPGRHLIFVRGQDADGNWGPVRAAWVNIFAYSAWFPFVAR
jgi:hypothetical protein